MKKQSNLSAVGRKLTLGKRTISNLKASQMAAIAGGGATKGHNNTCQAFCTWSCYITCNRACTMW